MARALLGLLVVVALGFTGAAGYKWYTGECPFGMCHSSCDETATVKSGCCTTSTGCCSENGKPSDCTGECPATAAAETKKDGCCNDGPCCPDGPCCKDKDKKDKKETEETPK